MSSTKETLWLAWRVAIATAATICALDVPARLVLTPDTASQTSETLFTVLFCADIAFRLRRARRSAPSPWPGAAESSAYGILWILTDAAAALPLGPLMGIQALSLLRLLKLSRVAQMMGQTRRRAQALSIPLRLAFFAYWLVLSSHWIACGWILLRSPHSVPPVAAYLQAAYWTVQTLSTVGYGDVTPANNAQTAYAVLVMIVGVGVYGYIIGNVAGMLSRMDPVKTRRRDTMETLTAFMNYRCVPPELQKRIRDYYEYLWDKRLAFDESDLLAALPPNLQTDVALFLKRDIVEKVPLFHGAGDAFVREIALQMKPTVFLPGDSIYKLGDTSRDMYFITHGQVEVLSRSGRKIATLEDGQFFGETGLLLGKRRSASVRAVTHCDLYLLDHDLFQRVLDHHPSIATRLTAESERRQAGNEASEKREPPPSP